MNGEGRTEHSCRNRMQTLKPRPLSAGLVIVSLLCFTSSSFGQGFPGDKGPDQWRNLLAPYLWAVNLKGEQTVGMMTSEIDASFGDLWSKLKFAGSVHYEGGMGQWTGFIDFSYINLGEDNIVLKEPLPLAASYRLKIYQGELGGTYRLGRDLVPHRWEALAGLRYTRQEMDLTIESPPPEAPGGGFDENWWDPFIGGRWGGTWGSSGRFVTAVRGDVGGFSVGSKFTANALAHLIYRFSPVVAVDLGFRYLYVDYDNGKQGMDFFAYKADQFGILLGVGFLF